MVALQIPDRSARSCTLDMPMRIIPILIAFSKAVILLPLLS
jgi:hypothetical protein